MTRRTKLGLGALVALLVLGAVFVTVLPEIVRRLAVRQLAQATGRAVALADVDVNLFTGRVALKRFRLAQRSGGDAALEFERLDVRVGLLSLVTSDIRVRELVLTAPTVRATRTGPTEFDFSDLLALIPPGDPTRPPRAVTLERLQVHGATVLVRDQVPTPPVEWRLDELTLDGTALTTRAGAEPGRLGLTARLNGAPLALRDGRLALAPLALSGRLALEAFELGPLRTYARDVTGLGPRAGRLTLALTLGLAVGDAGLTRADAAGDLSLEGLELVQAEAIEPTLVAGRLAVRITAADLVARTLGLASVELDRPALRAARDAAGRVDLLAFGAAAPPPASPPAAPFRLTVGELRLTDGTVTFADAAVTPATTLVVSALSVAGRDLAWPGEGGVDVRAATDLAPLAPYLVSAAGVAPAAGRATVALTVSYKGAQTALERAAVAGDVDVAGLALRQDERPAPFATVPQLRVRIKDADLLSRAVTLASVEVDGLDLRAARDAAGRVDLLSLGAPASASPPAPAPAPLRLTVGELQVTNGTATFADAAVTPATTLVVSALSVAGRDLAWPGEGGVDVRAATDLAPLAPYLVSAAGVAPGAGRATVALTISYKGAQTALERAAVAGDVDVAGLRLRQPGRSAPFATVPRLRVRIKDADLLSRAVTLASVEVDGLDLRAIRDAQGIDLLALGPGARGEAPVAAARVPTAPATDAAPVARVSVERLALRRAMVTFRDDTVAPATTLALTRLAATVRGLVWPVAKPATIELSADLPVRGRFELKGRLTPLPLDLDVETSVRDATIEPYHVYIPVRARFAGSFNGDARWRIRLKDGRFTADSQGSSWIEQFEIGAPGETPAVRVERIRLDGIDFAWPTHARLAALTVTRPQAQLERARDGALNLRELFAPLGPVAAPSSVASATPPASSERPATTPRLPLALAFERITIEDGYARFLDRSTTPAFSQTLDRLAVSVTDLTSTPGRRATLTVQAVLGGDAALDLRGQIAPLGELYADLTGELRDFALPSVNPYADSLVSWIMRSGTLGVRLALRIEHDTLTANNEIVIANLKVEPSGAGEEVKQRIGLPLGLIVALVTDSSGGITFNLPLSGTLSALTASLGDAVWAAVKNAIVNLIASPFRAIGRVFRSGDKIAELAVEPLTFPPGSVVIGPEMERHLTSVADFLRRTPLIKLVLAPVTTPRDVESLRAQELTARIQELQRELGLVDYAAAVTAEFAWVFPDVRPPETVEERLARLREREALPESRVVELAARRLEAVHNGLVKGEGLRGERLSTGAPALAREDGAGRIEFQITH